VAGLASGKYGACRGRRRHAVATRRLATGSREQSPESEDGFGLVFCVITLGWLVAYTVVLPKLGVAVGRSNLWRLVEGVTGAVLIGFGLRLALERR